MEAPTRRVLVAIDGAGHRLALDRQLVALGWESLMVHSGGDAIQAIEAGWPAHVLIVGVRLPDLDGRAVAWAIADVAPSIRVVFIDDTSPEPPLETPGVPYLRIPCTTSALASALARAAGVRPASRASPRL